MVQEQENEYLRKRAEEKIRNITEVEEKSKEYDNPDLDLDEQRRKFYQSDSKHNPEYRKESMRFREYLEERDANINESTEQIKAKRPRRFFDSNGKALNINEANVDFHYDDSDDANLVIEIMIYRYMDSSFINLDVQPTYLRYTVH